MCFKSKNLYNYSNYIIRQSFIKDNNWIRYNDLFVLVKDSIDYKEMGSNIGQATLRVLDKNWKSFFNGIKGWSKNPSKYLGRPKLPKYLKKDGRYVFSLDSNKVKLHGDKLHFAWRPFHKFNGLFKTKAQNRIIQVRFIPKQSHYVMEVVYEIEIPDQREETNRGASIDLGVSNFITIVNNFGEKPIVVKGGELKSINQYYNKKVAATQSNLKKSNNKEWSHRLQRLTDKRYEKIKFKMHCISKWVVKWCVDNEVDVLIIGNNKKWKQDTKHMQNFKYLPYEMFIKQVEYKCETAGVGFVRNEESYTSGTSFLDGELPTKENYDKSRRVTRGLFKSNKGININADVNGAYQILKKVFPDAFSEGIEGVGLHPMLLKIA